MPARFTLRAVPCRVDEKFPSTPRSHRRAHVHIHGRAEPAARVTSSATRIALGSHRTSNSSRLRHPFVSLLSKNAKSSFTFFFHLSVNHSSRACSSGHSARVASDDDEDDQDDDYRVFGRMTMKAQSEVGAPSSPDTRTGAQAHTHTHDRNPSRCDVFLSHFRVRETCQKEKNTPPL